MAYEPLSADAFEALVKKYEAVHGRTGRLVAQHQEFIRMVTALFDEARPKGRRFQLFIEWEDKDWVEDKDAEPRHTRDDKNGKPVFEKPFKKVPTGGAAFQLWEDVNYGTPSRKAPNELWKGCEKKLPRDADHEIVRAMMEEAFENAAKWPMKGE